MRRHPLRHFPLVLALLWLGSASFGWAAEMRAPAPPFVAAPGRGAVELDGPWQFHTGDDRSWSDPAFDDSGWELLTASRPWGLQGHPGYSGFAWYRRHLVLNPVSGGRDDLAILIRDLEQAYEVYWNGVLIGRCGKLPPGPVWYYEQTPHIFDLPATPSGVLAVRVWRAPPLSDEDPGAKAGFLFPPRIGTRAALIDAKGRLDFLWLNSLQFLFTESLVYGLVGVLSALIWLRHRDQILLFWLTGFTFAPALTVLLLRARLPIPYSVSMAIDQPIAAIRDISLWFLLLSLLGLRDDRTLSRVSACLAWITLSVNSLDGIFCAMIAVPTFAGLAQAGDAFATLVNAVAVLFPLWLVGAAIKRRKKLKPGDSLVALFAFLMEMVMVVRDLSAEGERYTHFDLNRVLVGPLFVIGGSALSLMDLLEVLLFASLVNAVYAGFSESRRKQLRSDQEMRSVGELQRVLVPDAFLDVPGFELSSAFVPAQLVGGDFFQMFPVGETETGAMIVIGDVSGKGLKAAMSVSFILGAIRGLAYLDLTPAQLLSELNRRLIGRLGGGFATCLVLRAEQDGRCWMASAAHPGPFIGGTEIELAGSLPLGLLPNAEYRETLCELPEGEICYLFTDGLLEARSTDRELFGYERLQRLFARNPTATAAADAAVAFGQDDDITVVSISRKIENRDPLIDRQPEPTNSTGEVPASIPG